MDKRMNSEAQFTTFEAISMIVGNSIGTGIIAVPYLATRNSMWDVVWMVALSYVVNVISRGKRWEAVRSAAFSEQCRFRC